MVYTREYVNPKFDSNNKLHTSIWKKLYSSYINANLLVLKKANIATKNTCIQHIYFPNSGVDLYKSIYIRYFFQRNYIFIKSNSWFKVLKMYNDQICTESVAPEMLKNIQNLERMNWDWFLFIINLLIQDSYNSWKFVDQKLLKCLEFRIENYP